MSDADAIWQRQRAYPMDHARGAWVGPTHDIRHNVTKHGWICFDCLACCRYVTQFLSIVCLEPAQS